MKREKLSFLVLIVEIAAIVFLHSTRNKQVLSGKMANNSKANVTTSYQLQALPLSSVK
jgi:hypothetical protein